MMLKNIFPSFKQECGCETLFFDAERMVVYWKNELNKKVEEDTVEYRICPGGFLNAEVRILKDKGVAPDATCAENRRFGCGVAN